MADALIVLDPPDWADPWRHPEYFTAITIRRVVAYVIDLILIFLLVGMWTGFILALGIITFGLAWALAGLPGLLAPLLYHSLLVAGPKSATLGMRAMRIRVCSMTLDQQIGDGRPTLIQAIILTVAFYLSVTATGSLILLVTLFNPRRRAAHDWLAGTVVVNDLGRG